MKASSWNIKSIPHSSYGPLMFGLWSIRFDGEKFTRCSGTPNWGQVDVGDTTIRWRIFFMKTPVCKTHPEIYDPSTLDPDVSVWIDHDIFGWTWGKVLQIKVARFVDKVESTHQDGISHQQDRLNAIIVCWTSVTLTCNRLPSYDSESIQMCSKKDRCMHRQLCTHMLKYSDSYIIKNQNWI